MIDYNRIPVRSIISKYLCTKVELWQIRGLAAKEQWTLNVNDLNAHKIHPSKIYTTDGEYVGVGFLLDDVKQYPHTLYLFQNYALRSHMGNVGTFQSEDTRSLIYVLLDD